MGKLSNNIRNLLNRVRRVLLVDDDDNFCVLLRAMAERDFMCEVVISTSVAAAREKLEAGEVIDAAILDARVTNGSGVRLYQDLNARWAFIPVVFLTGYDSPEFRKEVEAVGPAPVYSKNAITRPDFLDQLLPQFGIRRRAPAAPGSPGK